MSGCTAPDTYWARALARLSLALLSRKRAAEASCRPKALITSWPVKNSSSWECSSPVLDHCSVKWACDLRATSTVSSVETGTVSRAIRARSGESHSIMASAPKSIRTDMMSWLSSWLSACETLSTSLVALLRTSPRCCSSKWLDGSTCSFSSTEARSP